MKEDLSIAKNNILSLQEENRQLKKELGIEVKDANEVYINVVGIAWIYEDCAITERSIWFQNGKAPLKITETTAEMEELRSRLESEKKSRQDLEKELELQVDRNFYLVVVIIFVYLCTQE